MKRLETIKSIILVFLIGMSLILSFSLWNFQPKYGTIQSKYVSEADIGGEEKSKRSVIKPKSIIFHKGDQYYSFHSVSEEMDFFERMYEWDFTDISAETPPRIDIYRELIEIQFPVPLKINFLEQLFSLEDWEYLPNWSFTEIFILPNKQLLTLDVYFVSLDGEQALRMTVNNSDVYMETMAPLNRETSLAKYVSLETEENIFYLPEKTTNLLKRSLAIEYIDPALLVNALFRNPSLVSHTIGETNYNDGQRMMQVLNDGRSMEFTNPIELVDHLSFIDLLDTTVKHINEHKGWTNSFFLDEINTRENRLQFKMYYEGYPIFSHEEYSMIEQRWEGQELYQYKRPLFKMTNLLNSEPVTLPSGVEVIEYLTENENYQLDQINDIRIGYRLTYEEGSLSVKLEPSWYLKYNERWTELVLESEKMLDKEGV